MLAVALTIELPDMTLYPAAIAVAIALISAFGASARCAPTVTPSAIDAEASEAGDDVSAANPTVRVLLNRVFGGASRVYLTADGPFRLRDEQGNTVVSGTSSTVVEILPAADPSAPGTYRVAASVTADGTAKSAAYLTASTFGTDTSLRLSTTATGKRYPYGGTLVVASPAALRLRIIDNVLLEDYVRGVIKAEIGDSAPPEALKAQAVASRTYAVHNMGKLVGDGADVDDTTRSQGFVGLRGDTPAIIAAARDTRGKVLTYNGDVIDALYCTECGGITAQGAPSEPYLRPVTTQGCELKPGWTAKIDAKQAMALAKAAGVTYGKVKSIEVAKTDDSGRAVTVSLVGTDETKTIAAVRLRQLLGVDTLRSTLFTVKPDENGGFVFTGKGWGHGLGMCQCGAVMRASGDKPETYDQILADYYPGTQLAPLTADLLRRGQPTMGTPRVSLKR